MRLGFHPLGQGNGAHKIRPDDEISQPRLILESLAIPVDERARMKPDAMLRAPRHRPFFGHRLAVLLLAVRKFDERCRAAPHRALTRWALVRASGVEVSVPERAEAIRSLVGHGSLIGR